MILEIFNLFQWISTRIVLLPSMSLKNFLGGYITHKITIVMRINGKTILDNHNAIFSIN
jgi:ribosomal protein S17E